MTHHRILFIDAYDSFSNNITSLLATLLCAHVDVIHIDSPQLDVKSSDFPSRLSRLLSQYDAVVCGPGPGSPDSSSDVGLMKHIWKIQDTDLLPVLGICLGFQSLAINYGATIRQLSRGLHGMIRQIDCRPDDGNEHGIFSGVASFQATLYHSLCVDIGQDGVPEPDWPTARWSPLREAPELVPEAWIEEPGEKSLDRILMAIKHREKPFWGLQYHPESVCSESTGHMVISSWFREATRWNMERGRVTQTPTGCITSNPRTPSLLSFLKHRGAQEVPPPTRSDLKDTGLNAQYARKTLSLPAHVETPDIVELLDDNRLNHIVLDSASANARRIGLDVRGRYSIIALDVDEAARLEYQCGSSCVTLRSTLGRGSGHEVKETIQFDQRQTIWHFLAEFLDKRRLAPSDDQVPFIGGFMGFITYELGLECIEVGTDEERQHERPDLCFAWITKSVVLDHLEGLMHIQHLRSPQRGDTDWVDATAARLTTSSLWSGRRHLVQGITGSVDQLTPPRSPLLAASAANIQIPNGTDYEMKVRQCQEFIAAGHSYELCLTDQTRILLPKASPGFETADRTSPLGSSKMAPSWRTYQALRARQPAPFGSYIRLGEMTLISSSPERFLSYSASGLCSMRPMKGTVRKSDAVSTLEQAEEILHIPKEMAENLMIVDLVRHDLHSVCGPGAVAVPKLMQVEEYASVFQMVSVVEGQLPDDDDGDEHDGYTGLDVLAASLPPGSMTGAPKKRSCEILRTIEGRHRERSMYSGVVGYMDAAGRGDWSVTIRSLFSWDDEAARGEDGTEVEVWHIGAGGAVTALSTPEGERDEMMTKLKGPLGVFQSTSSSSSS